ncbi:hypothetical protein LXL04_015057 [Taraxacum kok-saghyz]
MTISPSGVSKRKPGRPPKHRSDSGLGVQGQMPNVQPTDADVSMYQPQVQNQVNSAGGSEPISPLKLGNEIVAVPSPPATESSAATAKRGRGRPPKVGAARDQGVETGSGNHASNPKMMSGLMSSNGGKVKRGRGRPKRIGVETVTVPLYGNVIRPRGRPKRAGRPNVAVNGGAGDNRLASRSGRSSAIAIAKLIRKPVGRPNKIGAGTAVIVTDPRQLVAYQELMTKYELLQSKVKQVVSVIKPLISHGSPASEVIQEIEDLAGTDTTEPFPQN